MTGFVLEPDLQIYNTAQWAVPRTLLIDSVLSSYSFNLQEKTQVTFRYIRLTVHIGYSACFMQENKLVGIKYADFQFELLPEILISLKGNA